MDVIDDIINILEMGDMLASIDIKDTYHTVHIYLPHHTHQGLKWWFKGDTEPTYIRYTRLCVGLSSSPYIFSRISDFVVRCTKREGVDCMINYLDDLCLIGSNQGEAGSCRVVGILCRLGFFISF